MEMLTTAELAEILRITSGSLRVRLSRRPHSLPKPVLRGRGSKTLWLKKDVEAWLASHNQPEAGGAE